jgi:hypothetical protein
MTDQEFVDKATKDAMKSATDLAEAAILSTETNLACMCALGMAMNMVFLLAFKECPDELKIRAHKSFLDQVVCDHFLASLTSVSAPVGSA